MSTGDDNKRRRPRLSAEQAGPDSGRRIASRSHGGDDTVGVREIAEMAGVDPAMVPRLFGSKKTVSAEIAERSLGSSASFEGPIKGLGERVARHLLGAIRKRTGHVRRV